MAVYTELSHDEITEFLSAYALPKLRVAEGIRAGVENTNYCLTLEDGTRLILTLFEKRVAESDLPFFADLMQSVAMGGVPCPKPVSDKNGAVIKKLKDKPALLVTFLEGKSVTAIQNNHMNELGANMARMHLATASMQGARPNALSLKGWKGLLHKTGAHLNDITPHLAHEVEGELSEMEELWPKNLPRGVIHADLFPDNVFYNEKDQLTGIIDFYFACEDFFAYELAICLNAWCFEKTLEFNITKAKLMLQSYHQVRPITDAELEALPVLARGAALRFLLTRAHDQLFPVEGALVTPKDPLEYWKKLRFHRSVTHHKEYGL